MAKKKHNKLSRPVGRLTADLNKHASTFARWIARSFDVATGKAPLWSIGDGSGKKAK